MSPSKAVWLTVEAKNCAVLGESLKFFVIGAVSGISNHTIISN